MNTQKIYDYVNSTILELLENAKAGNWQKEWISAGIDGHAYNPASGHIYSGVNQVLLSYIRENKNYPLNRWLSFKQVKDYKGTIKEDAKSVMVVFNTIVFFDKSKKKLSSEEVKECVRNGITVNKYYLLRYYNVFNVAQTEGLPERFYKEKDEQKNEFTMDEAGEKILLNSGAMIKYLSQDRAYYSPASDQITMPQKEQFKHAPGFYGTAFHELTHWTGHPTRLDRKLFTFFGSEDYAREELTAELTAAYLCNSIGFKATLQNSAAYIDSWIKAIKNDKTAFIKAASQASTAFNFILKITGFETLPEEQDENSEQQEAA
jgi:antirestriction protein ArdC